MWKSQIQYEYEDDGDIIIVIWWQELPQEAKRFQRIDKGWIKMMKRAYDSKNVLQVSKYFGNDIFNRNDI